MSQENVEVVRRIFDAVERRDALSVLALYDPAVELHAAPGTLFDEIRGGRTWIGHAGLRALDRELREAFENIETNCEELIDAGGRVVSASRYRARGRGSGIQIEGPTQFAVWTIEEGMVTRTLWFATREEALDAAGLA
jgi:ketosteroid isomerase-like protein